MKLELAGLKTMNMVGIRYWDNMNPWVDFVVYVPGANTQVAEVVAKKVRRAMDAYWDCEYDTYGEALEHALRNTVAFIVYHTADLDDFGDDEEFEAWEAEWERTLAETTIAITLED